MDNKQALKLLKKWKSKLKLDSYNILLRSNCKPKHMDGCTGKVEWMEMHSTAVINILGEKYYDKDMITSQNYEKTLVHELLHIKFGLSEPKDKESCEYLVYHKSIEDLSRLLTGYENKFKVEDSDKNCVFY